LTLQNSDFMVQQADAFARRVLAAWPADPASAALLMAFGRPASNAERAELGAFLEEQSQRHIQALPAPVTAAQQEEARRRALGDLCQMLLSANEFLYVD
jgi:hypothetical protein